MKRELVNILVCPVCKGRLTLKVNEEKDGEIIAGSLYCEKGQVNYPIADAIPHLLPPEKHA